MNVLMLSTTFIPSVILCGHSQLKFLESKGLVDYRFVPSHFVTNKDVEWSNAIIFCRSDTDIDAHISNLAKKAGKHLIYVLDDDILNVPNYLSSAPYYLLPSTQKNIKTIMSNCDTFLTTSPVLKEKYGVDFKNVFLIDEPSLNRIDTKPENKKVKIGFAGSIDRAQDLNQILEGTIEKLVNAYKDSIEIEIMGAKPEFVDKYHLTHLPYQDGYDAYTAYMSKCNWDIGLAPMPKSEFHRCKYFNKFVEYASFGIAGVYSNLEPYTYGIKNEENGLLVNNTTEEWFNAIVRLIENQELRKKISKECLRQAKEIYSLENSSYVFFDYIKNGYKECPKTSIPSFFIFKLYMRFVRLYRKIIEQKGNFPKWLYEKIKKKNTESISKIKNKINTKKILSSINENTIFVLCCSKDINESLVEQVKAIETNEQLIIINGEDRSLETIEYKSFDANHPCLYFNSFDSTQTNKLINYLKKGKRTMVCGANSLQKEKVSSQFTNAFFKSNLQIIYNAVGFNSEQYKDANNMYMFYEIIELEKRLLEQSIKIVCDRNSSFIKSLYSDDRLEIFE